MTSISVRIQVDDVLDELDTDQLAEKLVKRNDWQAKLHEAIGGGTVELPTMIVDLTNLVEQYRLGRPIDESLRNIAWNHLGRII